jgi:hypothetical protein
MVIPRLPVAVAMQLMSRSVILNIMPDESEIEQVVFKYVVFEYAVFEYVVFE